MNRGFGPGWIVVVALLLAGCAGSQPPPTTAAPRARCLVDRGETGARPLFFLFCVESP